MSAQKIIKNLYLGDQFSAPSDADVIINCAEELFPQKTGENRNFKQIRNVYYFNFQDMPQRIENINPQLVSHCLKTIDEHLKKNEKVYVHCLWGVNRSASMVFMYLVKSHYLYSSNLHDLMKEFQKNYSPFSPSPLYVEFIRNNYPFQNL